MSYNVRDLIGKRCLMKVNGRAYRDGVDEFRVLEISPAGTFVKLMNLTGCKFWRSVSECALAEVLEDLSAEKRPEVI